MNKQQLASKIWQSANKMRSKIEANEYKDYILGFIFYKFLSEQEERFLRDQGMTHEDMRGLTEDDEETVKYVQNNIGYFIEYKNLFSTWLAAGKDFDVSDVREALSAFSRLISLTHKKVFDGIFRTLETGLSKLGESASSQTKAIRDLIHLIQDIPMDGKQGYDVLGFIYEYLISMFAANAGKKAGEFYTPHEVSVLMSEVIADHLRGRKEIEIYDPTSGSGSLLINIGAAVAKHLGTGDAIKYYAQELKENTYNLTRMNLIMRGIKPSNIFARNGDTLMEDWPFFDDNDPAGTYRPLYLDAVVSNPPYSQNWDPDTDSVDPRFDGFGWAPKSKADYAFLLHDLYHLRPDGIMCIVLPHGVLFRGGEEGEIRRNLVERDHIQAIIGLPANIFFGTGIPTIVMVLRQKRASSDVLIVDASKHFEKVGKNNRLRASDIKRIVDAVTRNETHEKFSRLVSKQEIRDNGYNLNIPRYVDSSEPTENWDIYASMFGGIPSVELDGLDAFWSAFPGLRGSLFDDEQAAYASVAVEDIKQAIYSHPSVKAYLKRFDDAFASFGDELFEELVDESTLVSLSTEEQELADKVFAALEEVPLIDRYDAYQVLDDAWSVIAADIEMIQSEGFDAVRQVDPLMVVKNKAGKDVEVQEGWAGRVIPLDLVQEQLLQDETADLASKRSRLDAIDRELQEIVESFTEDERSSEALEGEESVSVVPAVAKKLVKAHAVDAEFAEKLTRWLNLSDEQKTLKREVKQGEAALEISAKQRIENLTDEEAQDLLDAKWIQPLCDKLAKMPHDVIDDLVEKVEALSKKYQTTFADLSTQIADAEDQLCEMLGQLVGNEHDMAGIAELRELLGGGRNA